MILYRVQVAVGTEWMNVWCASLAEGREELKNFEEEYDARLDKVTLQPGRDGFAAAMNFADANHMNFEGELIDSTKELKS